MLYCVRSDGEKFNCNLSVVQAGVCVCVGGGGGQHSVCEFLLCHFCDSMCSGGTHADLD